MVLVTLYGILEITPAGEASITFMKDSHLVKSYLSETVGNLLADFASCKSLVDFTKGFDRRLLENRVKNYMLKLGENESTESTIKTNFADIVSKLKKLKEKSSLFNSFSCYNFLWNFTNSIKNVLWLKTDANSTDANSTDVNSTDVNSTNADSTNADSTNVSFNSRVGITKFQLLYIMNNLPNYPFINFSKNLLLIFREAKQIENSLKVAKLAFFAIWNNRLNVSSPQFCIQFVNLIFIIILFSINYLFDLKENLLLHNFFYPFDQLNILVVQLVLLNS